MEQTTQTPQTPQGKGMAVAGFVISLVGLVLYFIIAGIVALQALAGGGYGLGIFWLVLCLLGTGLSVMGMMKLGKTGGKKGLSIAGMIIGLVAVILTLLLVMGISKAQQAGSAFGDQLKDAMSTGMQQMTDSLASGIQKTADSLSKGQ
ncbi:MAG: hypothetical protein ACXVPU_01685 [Bacteroidia bacterium]